MYPLFFQTIPHKNCFLRFFEELYKSEISLSFFVKAMYLFKNDSNLGFYELSSTASSGRSFGFLAHRPSITDWPKVG